MLGLITRLILTITALAPVLLTYGLIVWAEDKFLAVLLFLGALLLALLCVEILQKSKMHLEQVSVNIESAEAADRENIAFLLLYISPLFTGGVSDLNWGIMIPVLIVFGFVVATGYNYHFSPLLALFGWHAYKVGTSEGLTYVLLTKRQLRRALGPITVRQLTHYVVIEFKDGAHAK